MFTGIIRRTAPIRVIAGRGDGATLTVENPWAAPPERGESIAVNGACLTVVSANEREISFDVSLETLEKTTFAAAVRGDVVNLEPSLKVGQEISGHFVTGHVDGVGVVVAMEKRGGFARLEVEAPDAFIPLLVVKGSVAVNGVSLTIARLADARFEVALIPETMRTSNLASLKPGDAVNLEADLLGKYVLRQIEFLRSGGEAPRPLSIKRLEEMGY